VLACDFDPTCEAVYRQAFRGKYKFVSNIRSLTRKDINEEGAGFSRSTIRRKVPAHDILCAGFPCQPFSKSGRQVGVRDKTRGTLFFDIMEIVRARKPKAIILENVRNLVGPRHTDTWNTIIDSLDDAGYDVRNEPTIHSPHSLRKKDGGTPQVRERVFIVAIRRRGIPASHEIKNAALFSRDPPDPDSWRISDYLIKDSSIENLPHYQLSNEEKMWIEAWAYFVKNFPQDQIPGHPIWVDAFTTTPLLTRSMPDWEINFRKRNSELYTDNKNRKFIDKWLQRTWGPDKKRVSDFPTSRRKFEWQAKKVMPAKAGRTLAGLLIQMRPSGIRVRPPTYVPALVAITQTSILGPEISEKLRDYRKLTPAEAARLQGMEPDIFAGVPDKQAYKQLGNAVHVGVARYLAKAVLELLSKKKSTSKRLHVSPMMQRALPL
jgi:DNA (cytosine-5)-methyltransferase 1